MSKKQYNLNLEIEEFIKLRDQNGGRYSREEVAYINQYAGYGGLGKFGAKGKGLLSEYFTPWEACEKMMGLAIKHGYTSGPVCEPSVGVGRFLHYVSPDEVVDAYEINPISARICEINFPHFKIHRQYFNEVFITETGENKPFSPKYNLVIGNPPYGDFEGRFTKKEQRNTGATKYVEYFITRGLDLLLPGGLLIYIIQSAFLNEGMTAAKEAINAKSTMLEAYRMPNNIFDETDEGADIVVFQKN